MVELIRVAEVVLRADLCPKALEMDIFNAVVFDDQTDEVLRRLLRIVCQRLQK